MAETRMSLKLLVDKRKQRVLFAEGEKDFVDFLFTILSLSIGAAVKLLAKSGMGHSIIKLYKSLEDLDPTYMNPRLPKATLLCTIPSKSALNASYCCLGCSCSIKNLPNLASPTYCEKCLTRARVYVASAAGAAKVDALVISRGYVKDKVTYMIMDDLVVKPISAVALLNRLSTAESESAQEIVVYVGIKEALDLLKASLQSTTVLTDVFLGQERSLKSNEVSAE